MCRRFSRTHRTTGSVPRRLKIAALLLAVAAGAASAQQLDLVVTPQFLVPVALTIADGPELFRPGFGVRAGGLYALSNPRWLRLGGDVGFELVDTEFTDAALSMITLHGTAGAAIPLGERAEIVPLLSAGYAQSLWAGMTGSHASVAADLQLGFRVTPQFSLTAGGGLVARLGLFEGARAYIGASYGVGRGLREPFSPIDIRIQPVFPILYQFYDHGPFGSIVLNNTGPDTLSDVRLSFFVSTYMDSPKTFARFDRVRRGELVEAELLAMFNNRILRVTEGERVTAEITVEYTALGRTSSQTIREAVQIHNRNALTWDDDRKAAAFVTARDPNVLRYARNTAGIVEESPLRAINTNFTIAMALFESFHNFGITYVVDPQSAYEKLSQDALALDFVQFPSQTLEYRAGDCDDLAILFNALLESVGIETAFITTPGHIYSAFSLDMWPDDAERTFGSLSDLIVEDDTVWLPVEITALRQGFVGAWQVGARQWREHSRTGEAEIYLTRRAWQVYPPVGSPGDGVLLTTLPDRDRLIGTYNDRLNSFITRSIHSREQELLSRIRSNADVRPINALGVLYARHGLFERAEQQFLRVATRSASARTNLGNIAYVRNEYPDALVHYQEALLMEPENTVALLGAAKAQYQLNDHAAAAEMHAQLAARDETLAARHAWITGATGTARASSAEATERMTWDE